MQIYTPTWGWNGFLVHCSSQKRMICFGIPLTESSPFSLKKKTYYLSFPDVLFRIGYFKNNNSYVFNSLYFYFADRLLLKVGYPCLPNIGYDCDVCLGDKDIVQQWTTSPDLKIFVANVINYFWKSEFNWTYTGSLLTYSKYLRNSKGYIQFLTEWEQKTKTSDFVPELVYHSHFYSQDWELLQ